MSEENDVRIVVAKYLESQGWSVVLVGEHGIKKPDPTPLKYEYTMQFLGKRKTSKGGDTSGGRDT